jgi:hypothetical protein
MAQDNLLNDLDYIRTLAEEGRAAPLVGGRTLTMYGALFTIALVIHWAIISNTIAIGAEYLIWLWVGFGVLGGVASFFLDRSVRAAPGAMAANNRAAGAIWSAMGLGIFALFCGAFAATAWLGAPVSVWNLLPGAALAFYGVAHLATGFFHRDGVSLWAGAGALAAAAIAVALIERPEAYLAAAAGVVLSTVIPGLIHWAREPKTTV